VKHHNNEIYDVSFNYNGNIVATCGGDRMIKLYDVANMKSGITIPTVSVSDIFLCVNLDYTGDKLLAGSSDHHVQIFSSSTGKLLHTFVGHGYKVNDVSWSSSKEKCVSGSEDKQIKIWDIEKSTNTMSITCGKPVKVSKCSNIEPIIYSGHSDGSVRVYSLSQSTTPITQIKGIIDEPISSVVVLSNRYELLVASQEGTPIHLFDLKMNKSIRKYDNKNFFNTKAKAEISPT
jgi:WD40 repeat protein